MYFLYHKAAAPDGVAFCGADSHVPGEAFSAYLVELRDKARLAGDGRFGIEGVNRGAAATMTGC